MNLLNRMKEFEGQYVFLRWATGAEYGKVILVGDDFIEFNIIDVECPSDFFIHVHAHTRLLKHGKTAL